LYTVVKSQPQHIFRLGSFRGILSWIKFNTAPRLLRIYLSPFTKDSRWLRCTMCIHQFLENTFLFYEAAGGTKKRKEGRSPPFRQFAPDLYKTQIYQTFRTRPGTFWRRTCKAEPTGLPKNRRARVPRSSEHQGCSQNSAEVISETQIIPSVCFASRGLDGKRSLASYSLCLKRVPKLGK